MSQFVTFCYPNFGVISNIVRFGKMFERMLFAICDVILHLQYNCTSPFKRLILMN